MKVSLLLLTHDRYQMTKYCLEALLSKIPSNITYELLILDNGSKDERTKEIKRLDDKTFRLIGGKNIGIAAGFNKLLDIAKGEYIVFLSNDILVLNDNWLSDLIYYNETIEKSGLTTIYCEGDKGMYMPLLKKNSEVEGGPAMGEDFVNAWKNQSGITSGISLINRNTYEKIGHFDSSLGIYGRERQQYARRLSLLGFYNYYIPGQHSIHLGREVNDTSDYAKEKEKNLQIGNARYDVALAEMRKTDNYKL